MSLKKKAEFFKEIQRMSRLYPKEMQRKVFQDYLYLYDMKGLTLDEYRDFAFESQDENFRRSFLGLNEQRCYIDLLNPKKYYIVARNKFMSHRILERAGVVMPELYAYYSPEGVTARVDDTACDLLSLMEILRGKNVQSCVMKASESSHGDGVVVVKGIEYGKDDCTLHLYNGEERLLSAVLKREPVLFESVVEQTKQLASFNETSVNTVRFMTTLMPDNSARVVATFVKIGRAGKCVDNAGGGGNIDSCVDLETGELKYSIQFGGWRNIKDVDRHPDSGVQLNGVKIDNWEAVKAKVCLFQRAFPFCKAAGWDIAITDNGPVVIEVNDMWDTTGQLFIRRGWREEIRDCYLKWKETGVDYIMSRDSNALNMRRLKKVIDHEWR